MTKQPEYRAISLGEQRVILRRLDALKEKLDGLPEQDSVIGEVVSEVLFAYDQLASSVTRAFGGRGRAYDPHEPLIQDPLRP